MTDATNRRVLVVDDMPSIHDDFRKVLARKPPRQAVDELEDRLFGGQGRRPAIEFEVDSALQGQEALAMVQAAFERGQPYAVAFVDMRMPPGWDGVETIERLWQVDPRLQVVVCTAFSDHSWSAITDRLDAGDRLLVLKKPFEPVEARQLAASLSSKWQMTDDALQHTTRLEQAVQGRTRELADANNILTHSPIILYRTGPVAPFALTYISPNIAQFGFDPAHLVANPNWAASLIDPGDIERVFATIGSRLQSGSSSWSVEFRVRLPEGEEKWVENRYIAVRDAAGRLSELQGIVMDITARKLAQLALRQSEALSRASEMFLARTERIAGVGGWKVDLLSQAVEWSDQTVRIHGLEPPFAPTLEQAVAFFTPESRVVIERVMREAVEGGSGGYDVELQIVTADGRERWVRSVAEIEREGGRAVRLTGTFHDITARREMRSQAQRNMQLLRGAIDAIDEAFVLFGPDERVVLCNEKYRALFGDASERVVVGASIDELALLLRDSHAGLAPAGGAPWFWECRPGTRTDDSVRLQRLPDGRMLRAVDRVMPDGHIVGLRVDVTELTRITDAAQQALVAKNQFLANMSHEIRTPMNAILGMLALLRRTELSERQSDYAARADGAARLLLGVLNEILDFSKIESAAMTIDAHPFSMEAVLRELSVIASANVGDKPVELLFDVEPGVPDMLVGDAMRLQQVLVNLVGNAIKFTAEGSVTVSIWVCGRGAGHMTLEIAVTDTGIGIAADNQERIFDGFTQAEASTTRRFGGTGLGLAISRRLVELMGGQVSLASEPGIGSRFSFALEFATVDGATAAGATAAGAMAGGATADSAMAPLAEVVPAEPGREREPGPERCVQLVARDPTRLEPLARMARGLGWQVEAIVGDGLVAATPPAARPELIVVDYAPGVEAWHAGDTPIVVVGSLHDRETHWAADDADPAWGERRFLVKPITAGMLWEVADELFGKRRGDVPGTLPPQTRPHQRGRLDGLCILIAEDNVNNQMVVRELLVGEGALVTIVGNGRQAVEALSSQAGSATSGGSAGAFDVVLMDLQMPVMDGLSATRLIRADPAHHALPIVAMTANATPSDRIACLAAGMTGHVGKPFDHDALVRELCRRTRRVSDQPPVAVRAAAGAGAGAVAPEIRAAAVAAHIDVDGVLARLDGRVELLRQLLCAYLGDLGRWLDELRRHAGDDDRARAASVCHSLRGVVGMLGVQPAVDVLARTERALAGGDAPGRAGDVVEPCCVFLEGLAPALRALHAMLAAREQPVAHAPADARPAPDRQRTVRQLDRIRVLLRDSDMSAPDAVIELRRQAGTLLGEEGERLLAAVERLRFDEADALCGALVARLAR